MREIIWKSGAEGDLLSVFARLEEFHAGAGERLTHVLDATLQNVRNHPEIAPVFDPPIRRMVVARTGYGIFYTVEARGIIVHALIDLRQDPQRIREKVRRLLDLD